MKELEIQSMNQRRPRGDTLFSSRWSDGKGIRPVFVIGDKIIRSMGRNPRKYIK